MNGPADSLVFDKEEVAQVKWLSLDEVKSFSDAGQLANSVDQKVFNFIKKNNDQKRS